MRSLARILRANRARAVPGVAPATVAALTAAFAMLALTAFAGNVAAEVMPKGDGSHASRSERAGQMPPVLPAVRHDAFFAIAPDMRLCPSPLCGGYWVTRVNSPFTVCADGTAAPSCYVIDLDLARTGFSDEQRGAIRAAAGHLLMQGSLRPTDLPFGKLAVFDGRSAWIGHAGITAAGTFYRARDTGIVCIAYPCPSIRISPLNRRGPRQLIAGVDLAAVTADPEDGYAQLTAPRGLIAAGELVGVSGPAGSSVELRSSEYYLPVVPDAEVCEAGDVRACGRGEFCDLGGKAQCGRADVPGVCELRPQACIELYDPVCGCDGNTYGNACAAHSAGVGVDHAGACP